MTTARTSHLRRSRWFFVDGSGRRSRRPVDVAMVAVGVLLVLASAGSADSPGPLQQSILDAAEALPTWATNLLSATYALSAVYVVVVVVAVIVTAPHRGSLPLAVTMAAAVSFVAVVLVALVVEGGWPDLNPGFVSEGTQGGFPTVRVAVVTAVLLVLRPWIVVSFRRFNALVVTVECVAAWAVGIAGLPDIIGALGLGMAASGVVLIVLGSPGGHPDLAQVSSSLEDLGVRVLNLRFAARQPWGVRLLLADSDTGQQVLVKVYGRDATDAQLAARLWRSLVYTDQKLVAASRLQLVEHEALVTILAERAGATVTPVVAAAAATEGDAVLVLDAPPPSFAEAGDEELSDDALRRMWLEVGKLHALDVCHGELTLDHIGAEGGHVVISDFSAGSLGSSPQAEAREVATLLTSQALRTGPDRAVHAAVDVLGGGPVAAAQAYLQRAAVPRSLRSAPGLRSTLSDLQQAVPSHTGIEPAPLAQVARVSWRDIIQTGVVLLAAYVLLTLLAGIDWETVFKSWADADWGWVLLALVVVQGTVVADAVSTMSWATARLPLWPVMMLQYSIKMVGMAFSATASRVALNTAFLRRFGMNPTEAVTGTALDSVADWIVKVLIVVVALVVGGQSFDVNTSPGSADTLVRLVVLLAIAAVVAIVVVVSVPRLRLRAVALVRDSLAAARVVTGSPSRGFLLLGSNLASLMITAAAMYCNVRAIHTELPYDTILVVTTVAALLTTVLPSPGNVGVGEAAIAASLVAVGVPSGPAFAIAVTQRICTSYLPPVIGAFALRWLRRQDYLA